MNIDILNQGKDNLKEDGWILLAVYNFGDNDIPTKSDMINFAEIIGIKKLGIRYPEFERSKVEVWGNNN